MCMCMYIEKEEKEEKKEKREKKEKKVEEEHGMHSKREPTHRGVVGINV